MNELCKKKQKKKNPSVKHNEVCEKHVFDFSKREWPNLIRGCHS